MKLQNERDQSPFQSQQNNHTAPKTQQTYQEESFNAQQISGNLMGRFQKNLQTQIHEVSADEVIRLGDIIIRNNDQGKEHEIDSEKIQEYEQVADELLRRGQYLQAIKIYTIIINTETSPKCLIKRAECRKNNKQYIEAAEDLAKAADLAPNSNSTISSQKFYYQMENYYRDMDIKYW